MRIHRLTTGALGALAVAAVALPTRAHACSCSPDPIYDFSADPRDGEGNVALDAAPVFNGAFVFGSVTVEDSDGQQVDVTVNEGPVTQRCPSNWAEIIPNPAWEPNETYHVRVTPMYPNSALGWDDTVTFTTGEDMLADADLTRPEPYVRLMPNLPGTSCGPIDVVTCIDFANQSSMQSDVELIARRNGQVVLRRLLQHNEDQYGLDAVPDCMEFRRRAPNGDRSEPVMVCGEDLHLSKLANPHAGLPSCERGNFETKSEGCTVGLGRPKNAAPAWVALGALLTCLAVGRRRARSRRALRRANTRVPPPP